MTAWASSEDVTEEQIRRAVADVLQRDPRSSEQAVMMAWRIRRGVSIDETERSRVLDEYKRQAAKITERPLTETDAKALFAQLQVAQARRQRPLWLMAALTLVTFGLYAFFWLGASWAEMKRELRDPSMHPWWHVFSLLVPIYGLAQFYQHFERIKWIPRYHKFGYGYVVESNSGTLDSIPRVYPGWALIAWMVGNALERTAQRIDTPSAFWLSTAGVVLSTAVVLHGQHRLSAYWRLDREVPVATQTRAGEWVTLALGGIVTLFVIIAQFADEGLAPSPFF